MSTRLNPYLNFNGNAREAIQFYHSVFGGELTMSTFAEGGMPHAPADKDKIMHAQLVSPSGYWIMASDTPPGFQFTPPKHHDRLAERRRGGRIARLLEQAGRRRYRHDAARKGAMGRQFRHAHRQVRHTLDGQYRCQHQRLGPCTREGANWSPLLQPARVHPSDHSEALT